MLHPLCGRILAVLALTAPLASLSGAREARAAETAAPQAAYRFFLPLVINNKTWRTHVSLANTSADPVEVEVYLDDVCDACTGQPVDTAPRLVSLAPHAKTTLKLPEEWTGVVRVWSRTRVAATALLRHYPAGVVKVAEAGANAAYEPDHRAPANINVVPVVHRNNHGWNSELRLVNTMIAPSTATIEFRSRTGVKCTHKLDFKPRQLHALDLRKVPCLPDGFAGAAVIRSSEDMAVANLQFATNYKAMIAGIATWQSGPYAVLPLLQNNNHGYLSGFSAYSTNGDTKLRIRYFNANQSTGVPCGSAVDVAVPVWPYTVDRVADALPATGCAPVLGGELFASGAYGGFLAAQVNQLKNMPDGSTHASGYPAIKIGLVDVTVPQLYNGGTSGLLSGMQVMNFGKDPAKFTIRYYRPDGSLLPYPADRPAEYTLAPYGSVTVMAPAGLTDGSARVVTSQGWVAVVVNHLQTQGAGDQLASYSAVIHD
jgi:hypothetical protein